MSRAALLLFVSMTVFVKITQGSTDSLASASSSNKFFCEYNILTKLVNLEQKTAQQEATIESLKVELNGAKEAIADLNVTLTKKGRTAQGSSYIRWGRHTCPGDAELVYDGYAAGAHYTHPGTAANTLCLPTDPNYNKTLNGFQNSGRIYGAEYQTGSYASWKYLDNHDVPCAVCRIPRNHVLLIPAKNVCHENYVLEYKGYLMSEHYNHHASEFLCVDDTPESVKGGVRNTNGRLFYFVESACGALKCPPYVDGWELTCAVCSYSPKSR